MNIMYPDPQAIYDLIVALPQAIVMALAALAVTVGVGYAVLAVGDRRGWWA